MSFRKSVYFIILMVLMVSCNPQKKIAGNYTYKTECLGVELDGSQTVKAWGNGRNRGDAIEQAKKNAVRDVLFNGIYEGKDDCKKQPVVSEVNAEEKYEDYFNDFFKDGGEFLNYVLLKDERIDQKIMRDRKGARQSVTHGIVLRILRNDLKRKMTKDKIIKE